MLTAIALTLAVAQTPTHLAIEPWTGKNLPTTTAAAEKYRLTVSAEPGSTVHLRATGVAKGWIGAFCNMRVCAPLNIDQVIPASGSAVIQFELIRESENGPKHTSATIISNDGESVSVPK